METKRCPYCHRLQRIENRECSHCGHSFERRRSRGGRSWHSSGSLFSLPAASPHHAGHYSGLHPEDQPYQSNKIVTPQRFLDDMPGLGPLQQEPEQSILPPTERALVLDRESDVSDVPTDKQLPPTPSRREAPSNSELSESQAIQETNSRDIPRRQLSRPFVQDVLSERSQSIGARLAPTEVISATYEPELVLTELQEPQKLQELEDEPVSLLPLEDRAFSVTNDAILLPEDLPTYMQEALRTKRKPSHMMSTALLAVGCSVLLATSIIVLALLGTRPTGLRTQLKVSPHILGVHDSFSLEGNGFSPNQKGITFTLEDNTVVNAEDRQPLRANTDERGHFSSQSTVPPTWSVGKHFISATDPVSARHFSAEITVQANLPTPPRLRLSTTQATFGPVVSSQTITLENSGGGQVVWQGDCDQPWLTLSPKTGTFAVSKDIQVTVNRQGMAPGDYAGHVRFWLQGQENTPSVLNVTMTVAPATAQLGVSATSLTYSTVQSHVPENQVITIGNRGEQALNWNAAVSTYDGTPWLALSLSRGVLSAGASQPLTVQVKSQALPVGTYRGLISFTGDANAQVQVALTVVAPSDLIVSPSSLAFTTEQTNQTLSLHNSGASVLNWTVESSTSTGRNWLGVTTTSGQLAPGDSVKINVYVHENRLASGSYQGMLTFSTGAQTKQVSVSFVVTRAAPTPTPTPKPTPTPTPKPTSKPKPTPTPVPATTSTPVPTIQPTRSSDADRSASYADCEGWRC